MASMYAQYLTERTPDLILETEKGFATYRYLEDQKTVYIVDIFVLPEFRKKGVAANIADQIVSEAKGKGYTKLLGSVVPTTKRSTRSMKVLFGYGMILESATNNFILLKKEI